MFCGAVVCFLVFIIMFSLRNKIGFNDDEDKLLFKCVSYVFGLGGLVVTLCSSICVVESGHVGVVIVFKSVKHTTLKEGVNFVNPFAQVKQMSSRTENYWMSHVHHEGDKNGDDSVLVRSSNGLQMPVDVSVPYRIVEEEAGWIYQNIGMNYVDKILRPALSTATRRAAAKYTAEELYSSKLEEFSQAIPVLLEEEINNLLKNNYQNPPKRILNISQVLVGYIGVPDTVKNAIEAKIKADQEQQAMDFQIMREKKEAERKKVEAEGIQKFQEIVTKGIDEKLLRWKGVEATLKLAESNNAKIVIIGAGKDGLPLLLNPSDPVK